MKKAPKSKGRKSTKRPEFPSLPQPAAPDFLERCLTEIVRLYRHSAVGRLCTGVIHNMNSPLQVISFQLELLENKAQEEAALLESLDSSAVKSLKNLLGYRLEKLNQMRQEVDRLREMMQRLALQAVHEDAEDYCFIDLNQLVEDELHLYQANRFFKHQVEKVFRLQPGFPPIYGHYIDFSQSFRHLMDNALEAMAASSRRVLTVITEVQEGVRLIRIGDTGEGISPEVRPHLFEPFFTTRGTGERPRAGLGLFLTRQLLKPYGGEVEVESQPGETWVTVRLPIS